MGFRISQILIQFFARCVTLGKSLNMPDSDGSIVVITFIFYECIQMNAVAHRIPNPAPSFYT